MNKLLQLRKAIKRRKPHFRRQDSHKVPSLSDAYRKPKGLHSKMREKRGGHQVMANSGYGSPRAVMHLDFRTGLMPVLVSGLTDLKKVNPKTHAARVAAGVGNKKLLAIAEEAKKLGITILNWKDAEGKLAKIQAAYTDKVSKNKAEKVQKDKKKEEKKAKDKKDESSATPKKEEDMTPEEKEQKKKELDKLLTKR